MLAKLRTFSLLGIEALPVEVEVDVSDSSLPKTVLVGLPEAAVKECTHRIERALVNSGFRRPGNRVVINLAPTCSRSDNSNTCRRTPGKPQLYATCFSAGSPPSCRNT
jgi:hypothetical protein